MTTDNKVNDTTRRAVIAADGEDARQIGEVWHRLECPCNQCAVSRREIAQFHERQTELENEHTQWLIDEWTKGCWQAWEDHLAYQEFAAHTQPLTTTPQPKLPAVLHRSDGETLLYESRFNSLHGAPGEGKTWVSLFCVVQAIRAGSRCAVWDFEDRAATTAARLQTVGAHDVLTSTNLVYVTPSMGEDSEAKSNLAQWLKGGARAGLVVIDAAESSGAPSDGGDVMPWLNEYVKPWLDADLTVLVIDHVAKQKIDRPRGQIGSQRKLAAVDGAAIYVAGAPWTKSASGTVKLRNDKDRGGDLPARMGKWVATIEGHWEDDVLIYDIDPPDAADDDVDIANDLLTALAATGEEGVRGQKAVRALVRANGQAVDVALDDLIQTGLIAKHKDGRANVYTVTEAGHKEI